MKHYWRGNEISEEKIEKIREFRKQYAKDMIEVLEKYDNGEIDLMDAMDEAEDKSRKYASQVPLKKDSLNGKYNQYFKNYLRNLNGSELWDRQYREEKEEGIIW